MIYLKKFENHTLYETYINGGDAVFPNVSICATEDDVHYNHYAPPETKVVAKYNVTTDTKTQMILGYRQTGQYSAGVTDAFTSVYVDGNEIEISDANINYTFDTVGEHTIKYELKDPTTIKSNAFSGVVNGSYSGVKAVSITIPHSVTSIGSHAFHNCSSLTSITIPDSVTSIGGTAFQNCYSLTSCTIGNGVTTIGGGAFVYCTSLTSVTIGNGVTTIDVGAFQNCSGLTSIVSNATTAPTIKSTTFQDVKTGGTLTVPSGSSGYDVWMGTDNYYLGKYGWTKVEQ